MLFGLIFLIVLIVLISDGISSGEYYLVYPSIFCLTMCVWGVIMTNTKHGHNSGCLPEALFLISLLVWMVLGSDYRLEQYFTLFMLAYFVIIISYILFHVNVCNKPRCDNLEINPNYSKSYNVTDSSFSETLVYNDDIEEIEAEEISNEECKTESVKVEGVGSLPIYERDGKYYLTVASIGFTVGKPRKSSDREYKKAIKILNSQKWEKLSKLDKGRVQYACTKQFSPNPDDFKWVVEYLSGRGTPENPKNPHSYVYTEVDGVEYKSIKVNKFFEGTIIYKMGDAVNTSSKENR